jgi:drug/metabolite transporter (DMT)-like permease
VPPQSAFTEATKAKLLLMLLALCWGLTWPAQKIALDELSPWKARLFGFAIGAACLIALCKVQGRPLAVPNRRDRIHILFASLFNVAAFGLFSTFAQLEATTSRVIIINYSMPIWGSLLAWLVLRERLTLYTTIGLVLCAAGLSVLVYPVASVQTPVGLWLALGCALSWAAGTVYMKWARIEGDLLAITAWQIAIGVAVLGAGSLIFEGAPVIQPLKLETWIAIVFCGMFGTGLGYFLWYHIIGKLSTATASLGSLANPVVGIVGSVILLGERPTTADIIGFALILAAAVCVLLAPAQDAVAKLQAPVS